MKKQKISKGKSLVAAGLFIGIGIGIITSQVGAFALIGLGVGTLAMYLVDRKK